MNIKKISFAVFMCAISVNANAIDYKKDNWNFKLNADGMIGFLEPKDDMTIFINDWEIQTQIAYNFNNTQRLGAVYSIDADSVDDKEYIDDAFVLFEDKNYGRMEIGMTDSVARKMGLGLPDVGYLRINDKSLLYKKLKLNRVLISDTTVITNDETLRLNLATRATEYGQYGLSVSYGDEYKYAIDGAIKFKQPHGKLKSAYYLAASFMNEPENYSENSFTPNVTADWRGQISAGVNLQYNSFIWGTSLRLIYDEKPIAKTSDGIIAGTGVSYDLLNSSISLSYLFSDTNLWKHRDEITNAKMGGDYTNTILASFRYKYSQDTAVFMSGGITATTPFFSVGIHSGF